MSSASPRPRRERGRDAEQRAVRVLEDERRRGRVPRGVAARLERRADAAGRERGRVRLALDQLLAGELGDRVAVAGRAVERVVLLGGRAGERLEPVRVVGRAALHRPLAHRRGDGVGERRLERLALGDRGLELAEHAPSAAAGAGRRSEKTFSPKTLALGWVRSAWPRAPPFGLHWAAATLGVRVRVGMRAGSSSGSRQRPLTLGGRAPRLFVHVSKSTCAAFAARTIECPRAPTLGVAVASAGRGRGDRARLRHHVRDPARTRCSTSSASPGPARATTRRAATRSRACSGSRSRPARRGRGAPRELPARARRARRGPQRRARSGRGSPACAERRRRPGGFDAVRGMLDELDALRARGADADPRRDASDLRDRAIATASVGLAVLLGLIALRLLRRRCGRSSCPVGRLQRFARELGARRYGARLPESGPPETIELAQAFNATAVSLEAAEAELRRLGERHLAELDAVFREAPLGLAFVDRELRFLRVNEELARFNRPARRRAPRPAGRATTTSARRCSEVIDARASRCSTASSRSTGRVFLASYFPVRDGGDDCWRRRGGHRRHRAPARRGRARAPAARHGGARRGGHRRRRGARDGGRGAGARSRPTSAAVLLVDGRAARASPSSAGCSARPRRRGWRSLPLHAPRPVADGGPRSAHAGLRRATPQEMAARCPVLAGLVAARSRRCR